MLLTSLPIEPSTYGTGVLDFISTFPISSHLQSSSLIHSSPQSSGGGGNDSSGSSSGGGGGNLLVSSSSISQSSSPLVEPFSSAFQSVEIPSSSSLSSSSPRPPILSLYDQLVLSKSFLIDSSNAPLANLKLFEVLDGIPFYSSVFGKAVNEMYSNIKTLDGKVYFFYFFFGNI